MHMLTGQRQQAKYVNRLAKLVEWSGLIRQGICLCLVMGEKIVIANKVGKLEVLWLDDNFPSNQLFPKRFYTATAGRIFVLFAFLALLVFFAWKV